MKREVLGAWLLALLLGLGLLSTRYMGRTHSATAKWLDSAGTLALAEDWEGAGRLFRKAGEEWEKSWHLSAALTDHEPMEEIDGQFAQLQLYLRQKERLAFAAVCAQLASQIQDIGDAHGLNWWNLL